MANEDPHALLFNLSSSIGSITRIPIIFPQDYDVLGLYFDDYVLGIKEHGALVWHSITEETFSYSGTRQKIKTLAEYNKLPLEHKDVAQDDKNRLMANINAMSIIRFDLPPDTFHLMSACDYAKEIWDRLKGL